jgi:hypothetical protein
MVNSAANPSGSWNQQVNQRGVEQSFWEADILDMLLPREAAPAQQDAELVRQFGFVPGLKDMITLRQVHALEHATVWVLGSLTRSLDLYSGMSTERGFYLYGNVHTHELSRAAQTALRRLTNGEADLAVHPRCGTNLSVGMVLTAGLVGVSLLFPRNPIEQVLGIGVATMAAATLTPELGSLAQRYLTTAIPFNLAIANITPLRDHLGKPAHFVETRWVD